MKKKVSFSLSLNSKEEKDIVTRAMRQSRHAQRTSRVIPTVSVAEEVAVSAFVVVSTDLERRRQGSLERKDKGHARAREQERAEQGGRGKRDRKLGTPG